MAQSEFTVLILNLGAQDLLVHNQAAIAGESQWQQVGGKLAAPELLQQDGKGLRARARFYRNLPQAERPKMRFPILEPLLADVRRQDHRVDLVILAATDQSTEEAKSAHDTIELAHLVKDWLLSEGVSAVEIIRLGNKPHLIKGALGDVGGELDRVLRARPPVTRAFFSFSGGIPAVNLAVLWESMRRFGTRGTLLQVVEPGAEAVEYGEPSTEVMRLPLNRFLAPFALVRIEEAMERHDWLQAAKLVRESGSLFPRGTPTDTVEKLLLSAAARKALEMTEAGRMAVEACKAPCCTGDPEWEEVGLDLRFSCRVRSMDQMLEHAAEIETLLERGQYADLLWRVNTMREIVVGYRDRTEQRPGWAELHSANPIAEEVMQRMESLDPLRRLRNRVVHEFAPADHAAFTNALAESDLTAEEFVPFVHETLRTMAQVERVAYRPIDWKRFRRKVRALLPQ